MNGARELASSVYGAFRLAAFRKDGMDAFNVSIAGFWHSFFAALLIAPVYLFFPANSTGGQPATLDPFHDALVDVLAYVIGWVAFPLAMIAVTRMLGREERYIGYIVAYNWSAVPQILLLLVAAVMTRGMPPESAAPGFIWTVTMAMIAAYCWFIARIALRISGPAAAGVVALDFALTIGLNVLAENLTGAGSELTVS